MDDIEADVKDSLAESVGTVDQLRVLLLFHGQPQREWTVESVCTRLYLHLVRLLAFVLILVAIIDKNRVQRAARIAL